MYSVILALAVVGGGEASEARRVRYSSHVVYHRPVYYYPLVYSRPVVYSSVIYSPPLPPGAVLISERVIDTQAAEEEQQEQQEPEQPRKHAQTEADKRMLKELMEMVPDAAQRKKVLDYWEAPGVDSKLRKEFYDEVMKKAKGLE